MRLIIIADDKSVSIDGVKFEDIDLSSLPENIHAVQWYGTHGEVEFKGNVLNLEIDNVDAFQEIINAWEVRKYAHDNPPPPSEEVLLSNAKEDADYLLKESDWSVLPDVFLANKDAWISYRQALRAIRAAPSSKPTWPTKPPIIWGV